MDAAKRPVTSDCLVGQVASAHTAESLAASLRDHPHTLLLSSGPPHSSSQSRFSFVASHPFQVVRSFGNRLEIQQFPPSWENPERPSVNTVQEGDPWVLMQDMVAACHTSELDTLPFPAGGCFGYWGYELKNFLESRFLQSPRKRSGFPDCWLGFYDSLVVFDHLQGTVTIVSTGLDSSGQRSRAHAGEALAFWEGQLKASAVESEWALSMPTATADFPTPESNLSREQYIDRVDRAQRYIRAGDIYQVNLSHRLHAQWRGTSWDLFRRLSGVSPAPFSAWLDCGTFQIVCSSPELFLRMEGNRIETRPIKGTRPRGSDNGSDARLARELRNSEKEAAELLMITDLLRNDLGKVCSFGSVKVRELMRLEPYAQVQHLVSTIEGQLRAGVTHLQALAACFPGGSITGAPKVRAMEIIDELEPDPRGPYTGALGYIGFNARSQLNIVIRTALYQAGSVQFQVGAGIVADSDPAAEYEETLAKAAGFFHALRFPPGPQEKT